MILKPFTQAFLKTAVILVDLKFIQPIVWGILIINCDIVYCQDQKNDSVEYRYCDFYPIAHKCTNCKSSLNLPEFLCGHNFKNVFTNTFFGDDGSQRIGFGFAFDKTSCNPRYGTNYAGFSFHVVRNSSVNIIETEYQFTYLKDNLFGVQFYFIKFGLGTSLITNYKDVSLSFKPELRLCDNMDYSKVLRRINISYSYCMTPFGRSFLSDKYGYHQFGVILIIVEKGKVS